MKKFLILSICLISSLSSYAARSQNSVWGGTFINKKFTDTFSLWAETQLRYNVSDGQTNQILYRTGLLQKLNETHSLGYLYAYIESGEVSEHRFTLQHVMKYANFDIIKLGHRVRFEGRTLESSDDDAGRFRYLIRAETKGESGNLPVVWDELFINLTRDDWTGDRDFDRNRFFLGVKKYFYDSRLEFGYLNQYVPREVNDIIEHAFVMYLFI